VGTKPAAGSVFSAVFSSVEVQAPSIHPLVLRASLAWTVAHTLGSPPNRSGTAGFAAADSGGLANIFLRPAGSGPVAHALQVFFRVVAVAIAVAKGTREEAPCLTFPQPLDRDTELAGGFRDPIRCASMLFHVISIVNNTIFWYCIFQDISPMARTRLPITPGTAPGVFLQVHVRRPQLRQVATDESGAAPFAPCLAIRVPAARIAWA